MELVNPREMLERARSGGYALGAFNIHNLETLQAVVEAAAEAGAPVILQATPGTVKYVGADYLASMARAAAGRSEIPVALHLDHASDLKVIQECIAAGFTSVMFDGSHLPLEENIKYTRAAVALAHPSGVAVEAELGRIRGREEGRAAQDREASYTDPAEAAAFVAATGVDSLAVAIGNAHGVYQAAPGLDFERLEGIAAAVKIPLVLHGASGLPDDDLLKCIARGISKINIATDVKIIFAQALRESLGADPGEIDPRRYMELPRRRVKEFILAKLRLYGAAGRTGKKESA
ncbi:MAG: class II fructose-bisphosphate aldolase [Moorellaceae bacterium]